MWRCVLVLALAALAGCAEPPDTGRAAARPDAPTGIRFLGASDAPGFARATAPIELQFPRDHGAHPEFRTEWWYFTGNLRDVEDRPYGFELTFFRIALTPVAAERTSAWGTNQVWMAHFAITDAAGRQFVAAERFARGALGLAGATADPLRVWVKDWAAGGDSDTGSETRLRLTAHDDSGIALHLELEGLKPPVAHGERGLDSKGPEPGNASYYYSLPRLAASGALTIGGTRAVVTGLAWMDREWGTSALSADVVGWDWFALQLSDGRDLMFYRLRRTDGTASPFSAGSLVNADGRRTALRAQDVALTILDYWTSERSGVRYPVAWRLAVPQAGIDLQIEPLLPAQELNLAVRYWEGAVHAAGRGDGRDVTAEGYLELAGY